MATKNQKRKKDPYDPLESGESWLNRTWRPAAAVVYLLICLFDFIIAPAFMGFKSVNVAQIANSIKDLDPTVAIALIQNRTPWVPLTMQGGGLFHVAFGAILGVAAWTRGSAQIEALRQQGESERSPYTPTMVPTYYVPGSMNAPAQQNPDTQTYGPPYGPQYGQPYRPTGPQGPSAVGIDNPDAEPDKY